MENLYSDERVIPNEALRKLLEKPLESKINTDSIQRELVIDVELTDKSTVQKSAPIKAKSKKDFKLAFTTEVGAVEVGAVEESVISESVKEDDIAEESLDERALQSWKALKAKLLSDTDATGNISANTGTTESGVLDTEAASQLQKISNSSDKITHYADLIKENALVQKMVSMVETSPVVEMVKKDPFYAKFILLLTGVIGLGLAVGFMAGIALANML